MKKAVVFLFLLLGHLSDTWALQEKTALKLDSSVTKVRPLDQAAIRQLKANPDFIYTEMPPESLSLWDKFWVWVWDRINNLLTFTSTNPITKWGFIIFGSLLLIFLVYRFLKLNKLFIAKTTGTNLDYQVTHEDIHQIDYEQEIQVLAVSGNYRLAVRLLYLRSLKHLSDHRIINWQPGKTNQTYLNEVENSSLKQPFGALTKQYDYIWYGRFPVDAHTFTTLHKSFDAFSSLIK